MNLLRLLLCASIVGLASGCDDLIGYDVLSDGRLIVAADAEGRTAVMGDGERARRLFKIDPRTGDVEAFGPQAFRLSQVRALGEDALFVESRRNLVRFDGTELRVLYRSTQRLFQPAASETGRLVSVLEATELGVPGRLLVLNAQDGSVVAEVERALLGADWAGDTLLVGRSDDADRGAWEEGAGEVVMIQRGRMRTLFRGDLAAVTLINAQRDFAVVTAPLSGADAPLGLAQLRMDRPGASRGEAAGLCDFWPDVSRDGEVLFTRQQPDEPALEGELRWAMLNSLGRSHEVPTEGPVAAPRWLGPDRVAYITTEARLVLQDLDGRNRVDVSERLRDAYDSQ